MHSTLLPYPAKKEYEEFLSSLPKDAKKLTVAEQLTLSQRAVEVFVNGIPHKDRPLALYYFYHLLPTGEAQPGDEKIAKQFPNLPPLLAASIADPATLDYIKLLDADKLYEVCQTRGELFVESCGVIPYVKNQPAPTWEQISEAMEKFISEEPCRPLYCLESYFMAFNEYSKRNNLHPPRRYELAKEIWETSTDIDSLKSAWLYLNDPDDIRAYKKQTLPPKEIEKVRELEKLETEVMTEFGSNWRGRSTAGKALQFLTKEGREEKQALQDEQRSWFMQIRRPLSFAGNDPYVSGYADFLQAHVCGGTEDWKGAIKLLKSAHDNQFDPMNVLLTLVMVLDAMKKYEEAADYAQDFIDISGVEEKEQLDENLQLVISVFPKSGRKPLWANRIWEARANENKAKVSTYVNSLRSQIDQARKDNTAKRTEAGIQLLDKLVSLTQADEAMNNRCSLSTVQIESSLDDFLELSLEEIEPFSKAGTDKLLLLYNQSVSLENLLKYNESLINALHGNLSETFEAALSNFPNTLACIPVAKQYINSLMALSKHDSVIRLVSHVISKRASKVEGLYDAVKPLQQHYHKAQQWRQEIDLLTKSRRLLQEPEHKQATSELIEAFVQVLSVEKSLNERNRLLKSAEAEQLRDERLAKIRAEVDALLNKRKQMLIKASMILGAAVVLFLIIYFLFLR
jgi:hypothetical protein